MSEVNVTSPEIVTINREDAVAMSITFRRLGDSIGADMNEISTSADKNSISAQKKLIACSEFDAIKKLDSYTYQWLQRQSVPLLGRRNVYLISKNAVPRIETELQKNQAKRKELIDKFMEVYPLIIEQAKTRLNGQYDANDYRNPSDARNKFGVSWIYLSLGIPENLPEEVKKEQVAKQEKMWLDAAEAVRDGLRVGFVELVEHLVERLTPDENGKAKVFHSSAIQNVLDFITTLESRNLTNDKELIKVANQAKALIENASADSIRKSNDTRKAILEDLAKVEKQCDTLISSEKRRKFNLE